MSERPHRRGFVKAVALGGLAAAPAGVVADEPKAEPAADPSEVDARYALVLARYGKQLDAEARRTIRAEIEAQVRRAEMLRKFPLDNGDGPFPVFQPYRAPIDR